MDEEVSKTLTIFIKYKPLKTPHSFDSKLDQNTCDGEKRESPQHLPHLFARWDAMMSPEKRRNVGTSGCRSPWLRRQTLPEIH